MSKFEVQVRKIAAIEPHNNADTLEFAVIDGYRSIVRKGMHRAGDLVVYIPEAAVCPPAVLKKLGLWDEARNKGKCAGEAGDRVRAMMLRGKLSQGVVYPLTAVDTEGLQRMDTDSSHCFVLEGEDVAAALGITKFRPTIPEELDGKVFDGGIENMPKFDVEDIKKFPEAFLEGEQVAMHEKLHGTFTGFMLIPAKDADPEHGDLLVFSKGLADQALAFQLVPENAENVYCKAAQVFGMREKLQKLASLFASAHLAKDVPVFIFGETVGTASKQDLKYGEGLSFHLFDAGFGYRSSLTYLDDVDLDTYAGLLELKRAPLLYRGPFSAQALAEHTSGRETLSGKKMHIREGAVVRPIKERRDPSAGRLILKSVSPDYLVRSGEATEYQ